MVNTGNKGPGFIESKIPQIGDKIGGVDDILSNNQIYLPEALELISKFGGKAASLLWQVKKGNGKYILPLSIIDVNSEGNFNIPVKLENFPFDKYGPLFGRASASGDQSGLVDVLQSIPVDNLQADISSIIAQGVSEEAKRYAHGFDNNIEYEGISSVILTQECTGRMGSIGSIIEHPNLWGHYVIDFLDGNYEILADASGKIIKSHTSKVDYRGNVKEYPLLDDMVSEIIEMKLDTDRVGFISGKTSQTEFIYIDYIPDDDYLEPEDFFDINTDNRLSKGVYFFQQREFRNFEAIYDAPSEYTFNSFGKFPDDIEEIKITKAIYSDELSENDFVLIFSGSSLTKNMLNYIEGMNLDIFQSPKLKGIIFERDDWGGSDIGSIEHGCYRFMMKEIPIKTVFR